jgi:hypothetical protein
VEKGKTKIARKLKSVVQVREQERKSLAIERVNKVRENEGSMKFYSK